MANLKTPDAPATKRQRDYLTNLTGLDYNHVKLTMGQAYDKIQQLELAKIARDIEATPIIDDEPFSEAHVTICEGDQRSGKSVYAVGKIVDSYFNDCVRIYCEDILKITCEVLAYYRKDRVAKIKYKNKKIYIQVPEDYELKSPMKIFANIHLYGLPYVYVPSFHHMLYYLKKGFISNGWLLMDEAHHGMSTRNGMSVEGREWVGELFQFGKSLLNVIIITHHARMIESLARTVPTQRVSCTYDKNTHKVTYTLRKKGQMGESTHSFDASQYWGNYRTNEKVHA